MKKIILVFLFLAFCGAIQAQKKYKITPSNTLHGTALFGSYTNFEIFQENISNDVLILKWKLLSNKLIKGWDYSTCAFGTCYAFIPDSLCTMTPIPVNESGFLALNLDPFYIKGTGSASIYVYEDGHPLEGDTVTFIINGQDANGIADYKLNDALSIYPNPAAETVNFKIENLQTAATSIRVINALGKEVYATRIQSTDPQVVNVNTFSPGIYFVKCDFENGNSSVQKLEIVK